MRPFDLLTLGLALGGCGPGGGGPTDDGTTPTTFDCDLGTLTPDGAFTALEADAPLEVVLGFQGFLYVVLAGRTTGPREVCEATSSLRMDDGATYGNPQPATPLFPVDGAWQTAEIMLFLPAGEVEGMIGRHGTVALRLDDAGASCARTAEVVLVDEDRCVRTEGDDGCDDPDPDTGP